ncbi:sensor histidine kinase, partial [Streptomyces sp. WELS2]|uniref:sensor histidine kinase n=1 Tax=Streptomyces sp. WELS2 TaxID=2749435 RepID=UPI0037DD544B
ESRELLADLRRDPTRAPQEIPFWQLLAHRAREFTRRTGLEVTCHWPADHPAPFPSLPVPVARHVLAIAIEALENAHRHASAGRVDVRARLDGDLLGLVIHDDGTGLPPGTTLERLRDQGHFGLLGMVERAAQAGARIRIGRGAHDRGTEVRLDIPLPRPAPRTSVNP